MHTEAKPHLCSRLITNPAGRAPKPQNRSSTWPEARRTSNQKFTRRMLALGGSISPAHRTDLVYTSYGVPDLIIRLPIARGAVQEGEKMLLGGKDVDIS